MASVPLSAGKTSNGGEGARTAGMYPVDSSSASCQKCVKVLRELIAGLQDTKNSSTSITQAKQREPYPLTLLKAIAGNVDGGQNLRVEMVSDGVKLHVPVETTLPNQLQSWKQWFQPSQETVNVTRAFGVPGRPLALSVNNPSPITTLQEGLRDPLSIELKCRLCASTGPEGGARAFLMGPNPLSVVVCHNRVDSDRAEIEEILTHELTHLYDVQTLRLDLQECENLAYSEVRAAKAAECRSSWHPHLQSYCVKQKAISATNNLFPKEGRACIKKVFEHAFRDNRPFDHRDIKDDKSSSPNR